jgi:hypothetical protein
MMLLQSTALPMLVVITQIGLSTDRMRPGNAAALVGAGMLSVLVLPLAGFAVMNRTEPTEDPEPEERTAPGPEAFDEL